MDNLTANLILITNMIGIMTTSMRKTYNFPTFYQKFTYVVLLCALLLNSSIIHMISSNLYRNGNGSTVLRQVFT